jgi:hypothetical protein
LVRYCFFVLFVLFTCYKRNTDTFGANRLLKTKITSILIKFKQFHNKQQNYVVRLLQTVLKWTVNRTVSDMYYRKSRTAPGKTGSRGQNKGTRGNVSTERNGKRASVVEFCLEMWILAAFLSPRWASRKSDLTHQQTTINNGGLQTKRMTTTFKEHNSFFDYIVLWSL